MVLFYHDVNFILQGLQQVIPKPKPVCEAHVLLIGGKTKNVKITALYIHTFQLVNFNIAVWQQLLNTRQLQMFNFYNRVILIYWEDNYV